MLGSLMIGMFVCGFELKDTADVNNDEDVFVSTLVLLHQNDESRVGCWRQANAIDHLWELGCVATHQI